MVSRSRLDKSLLAQLSPIDLTSVSQEPREQANRAVAAVVERLESGAHRRGFVGAAAAVDRAQHDRGRPQERVRYIIAGSRRSMGTACC